MSEELCFGIEKDSKGNVIKECPKRYKCLRFKDGIDTKNETHFAIIPYRPADDECSFYKDNLMWTEIQNILGDNQEDPTDGAYAD